ncbi:glycosyltransferase [Lonepinella sp. MS14437]|uniref:glycosyltransferase n=1 Tax=Lonepinella sp. MS14437 TaxID=3003620 RepID=UPI0036D84E6C
MKILILHKWLIMGGVERILINYLALLQGEPNLDIDILIDFDTEDNAFHNKIPKKFPISYIFDRNHKKQRDSIYSARKESVLNRIKYKLFNRKEKILRKQKLTDKIVGNDYDVVINFSQHFDPYIEFDRISVPIIRWQHLAYEPKNNHYLKKDISILVRYSKIIVISNAMREQMISLTNISSNKFELIFNPLNISHIVEQADILPYAGLRKEHFFTQVARLDKIKQHDKLIEIYAELVKYGRTEKLYILGNGEECNYLKHLIEKLNLKNRCILLGEVENPYPYIKYATLFLHTSAKEGLPTVLLESLLLNTPVVAMDCPTGPSEILDNGRCGALVTLNNKDEFVQKTIELLHNPEMIEKMQINMKTHLEKFSEQEIRRKFIGVLDKLVGK